MRAPRHTPRTRTTAAAAVGALALLLAAGAPAAAHRPTPPAPPPADPTPGVVDDAGFESGLTGWTVTGTSSAAKTEPGGHDGTGSRLTHWAADPYTVSTRQRVEGLADGWWTVAAWVRSGGGVDATRLSLTGCGVDDATTTPVTDQDGAWVRLAVSAYVVGGACSIDVTTSGPGGAWANVDDVSLTAGRLTHDVRGGDLSGLAKNEDRGATYAAANGRRGDAVQLLAGAGMNLGRLRVWVDPADGYDEVSHVVASARRIKAAGMRLLVDFHYSDTWADPGAQHPPAAWAGHTPAQLAQDVHDHTRAVLDALAAAGITADYVQVGNEINPGMLWPWGQTWDVDPSDGVGDAQWDNLAAFLTAGATAVREVSPTTRVILHLTNINNGIGSLTWWFDEVTARHVPFDVVGLSYYGYWHGSFADLQDAVSTLSDRYDRDVMVVETAYPFTLADDTPTWENVIDQPSELVAGYPATPVSQAAYVRAVQDVVMSAPGGRGLGAVYWEPTWTSVPGAGWDPADPSSGNAWENQALFDFDGRLLPAASEFAADPAAPGPRAATTTRLQVAVGRGPVAHVRVDAVRSGVVPSGLVVLREAGVEVGRALLDAHGSADVVLDRPAGTHVLTAQYLGDLAVTGSTSAPATVVVRR